MTTDAYYEYARTPLLDLLPSPPRRFLDVGCGNGATAAAAKARWPGVEAIGIEIVPEAAQRAAQRIDRVVNASAESVDWAAEGIAGVDAVLIPGDPERKTRAERTKNGVPLPDDTWAAIVNTAREVGVSEISIQRATQ